MENGEDKSEKRKEKIKNWLKNPYNLALVGILIFAFAIRLYYFSLTKSQPLWWDEAEYMSTAKSFAGIVDVDYKLALNRFPGFPFLVSLFYMAGISNEVILKFLLAFIPSLIAIVLIYFLLVSMYSDKRIALISTAILTVLWEHVFYSNRFHTENSALIFQFLALIILFGVYLKDKDFYFIKSKHALFWIFLFSILAILFRAQNAPFVPAIVLFLVIINFYKIPKKLRTASAIGLIVLAVAGYTIIDFLSRRSVLISHFYQYSNPPDWTNLSVFYGFYQSFVPNLPSIFFYSFLIGIIAVIGGIIIFPEGLKKVSKNVKDNSHKADIFNLILIAGFLFFFIFILRAGGFEYRWFFAFLPGMLAFTAKGLIKAGDYAQSMLKIKYLSVFLILILLCLGIYTQINHADMIIKNKLDSYSQVRDSGLWLKENSNPEDIIISGSIFQHAYYAERKIIYPPENETDFDQLINDSNPKYLVISVFQPLPEWTYDWPQRNNETVVPVQAYFTDNSKQQVTLIIYQFDYQQNGEKQGI